MIFDNNQLQTNGYVLLNSSASNDIIVEAQNEFQNVYKKAKTGKYKFIRVYDDYIPSPNIAAIEMPFHPDIINKQIVNLLNYSNIPEVVHSVLGDKIKLTLSRYHVTKNYSHIGNWHRDSDPSSDDTLQVSMFLFDEKGIELIPTSHKNKIEYYNKEISYHKYKNISGSIHLSAKAGQILIFNPSIVHRGISASNRTNIHFRFERDKKPEFNNIDFSIEYKDLFNRNWLNLLSNKNSITIDPSIKEYKASNNFRSIFNRLIKTVSHYFLFFLPVEAKIFKIIKSQPSIKLKKLLFQKLNYWS